MLACFTFQLGSIHLLKSILQALTRRFIEEQLLWRKFACNPLKTPVKEQQQKFTMRDLLSFTLSCQKFQVPETSSRFPNSQSSCYRSNFSLFHLHKLQNSYNFIDLIYSISFLFHNLWLINLKTREYHCTKNEVFY